MCEITKHSNNVHEPHEAKVTKNREQEMSQNLKGMARKMHRPKNKLVRFSKAQKAIMDSCYYSGTKSKSARYTAAMSQAEMRRNITEGSVVLTVCQINQYWSRRHRQWLNILHKEKKHSTLTQAVIHSNQRLQ